MKSMIILVAAFVTLTNCGNNKAATTEQQTANSKATENTDVQSTSSASTGDDIVGTWKLRLEVFDDNSNRIPDEAEMKKGYGNNYMFQFNADGTCRIQQTFTGRYEKKTENGRPMLYVYRKKVEKEEDKDPPPDIFQITSLKKDELVLQIIEAGEPSSFWFFKRIK
jgi:hypothetical protein